MSAHVENYEQAIEFLFSRINYERLLGTAYSVSDFKLDRMREFLARLGNPQLRIPVVHIAGTKGKGSTAAMIAAILTAAGYRTGLFTSPHISAFEERMQVDGQSPTPAELVDLVNLVSPTVTALDEAARDLSPTYFEIATALAWLYFEARGVQVAVLEVGLGGRLDATNVCQPLVTAITCVSRDHTRQLGSRLEQITREKAGIIKPGIPVICGADTPLVRDTIREVANTQQAPLDQLAVDFDYRYHPAAPAAEGCFASGDQVDVTTRHADWTGLPLTLTGEHQARNAAVAVAVIDRLQAAGLTIPTPAVAAGLAAVRWPGRIEVLRQQPAIVVDAGHNWAAVAALVTTLRTHATARRRVLVFAATQDKDVAGMLRQLLPMFDSIILTCYQNNPRALAVEDLAGLARSLSDRHFHTAADPAAAWKLATRIATETDLICVTGSFFIAAEIRELLQESTAVTAISSVG